MPGVRQADPVSNERRVAVWRDGTAETVPADSPAVNAFDLGLGRGDGDDVTIAAVDDPRTLGEQPLLPQRVAVMDGHDAVLLLDRARPSDQG